MSEGIEPTEGSHKVSSLWVGVHVKTQDTFLTADVVLTLRKNGGIIKKQIYIYHLLFFKLFISET